MELSEEEKRLDVMMEVERRKALETMEQVEELRKEERIRCCRIFTSLTKIITQNLMVRWTEHF